MSVLGSGEIERLLDDERDLIIIPPPKSWTSSPGEEDTFYDACSLNLRLGSIIYVPVKNLTISFDLSHGGDHKETLMRNCERKSMDDNGHTLNRFDFVLGQTLEEVHLPIPPSGMGAYAGRIEGRSSLARTGLLVHFTAPTIHAGFKGTITFELCNLGPAPIILRPEQKIAQLVIETVRGKAVAPPTSQYLGQKTPAGR